MDNVSRIASAPVVITCYGDMEKRARFRRDLDPKAHKLAAILGQYNLREDVACGLHDCHQWHNYGFLVVTEDGVETNIGHVCGANAFPADFTDIRKQYRARQEAFAHFGEIDDYRAKAPGYEVALRDLWHEERGGEWADTCLRAYHGLCPDYVQRRVAELARSARWTVTIEVKVDEENATRLGISRNAETETRAVGELRGGVAVAGTVESLVRPVRVQMDKYSGVDPASLSTPKRRAWANWSMLIPGVIETAQQRIAAAREFYTSRNLSLLVHFARDSVEERKVREFIRAIVDASKVRHRKAS